jgi:hypothetical protein
MITGVLIIGALLVATGLKGTENKLGQQLANDILGTQGFIVWALAICLVGAIGYIPGLESASLWLLALLFTVILVRNAGVWNNLQQAILQASGQGASPGTAPVPAQSTGGGSGGSGGGSSGASTAASAIGTIATIAAFL